MNKIPLEEIIIKENRQRQEFEPVAMQELINSIQDRGLMHPPVLRKEGETWVLAAGERRLRAIKEIYELGGSFKCNNSLYEPGAASWVPFTSLGELSDLEAEEVELDENLKRRDLSWQEHAGAIKRLFQLRQKQTAVAADNSRSDIIPEYSVADIAKEVTGRSDGNFQETIRRKIIIAGHLDNPLIAKAKTADEAFKILKKEEERNKNIELAKVIGKSFNSSLHELIHGDCLIQMADSRFEGQFDVILTDPPYGMDAQNFGDAAGRLANIEHHYDDSYENWQKLIKAWAPLTWQVTKEQAHLYAFCDFDRFHELKAVLQAVGWYVFRTPLINFKSNSGRVPLPENGPRRQYEICLYAFRGNKPVTHIYPDVMTTSADENMSHGAQKPVALYQNLLQRSVRPGDSVLDCFCGTGPIFPAANLYQCKAVGIEQSSEYYAMSVKRLQELKLLDSAEANLP